MEEGAGMISPPGDTMLDILEERGLTTKDFAKRMGNKHDFIIDLITARQPINYAIALNLSEVLGSNPQFWLERERQYREKLP